MLSRILITLLVLDSLILVAAILLQAGKGGGLAATFGGASSSADSIMGTRQAGNLLTKISWWTGGIFIGLSFILSLASSGSSVPKSVLDQTFTAPPAPITAPAGSAPAGGGASVLPVQPAPAGDAKAPDAKAADTKTKTPSTKTP